MLECLDYFVSRISSVGMLSKILAGDDDGLFKKI